MEDNKKQELTDEQLWLLCKQEEKKKKIAINDSRDKGVDWEYERLAFEKWNR